ncbi:MAG: phospho-N-acetylmuramoyl-pentapeptide-transferase [Gemmatimonadaceae bacterium]|nr:phospho-N-acetylmuramoyl-pentapeptide-transferase [Gemmatimonadaceae bacterium]NUO95859.1 phospho-N-acetylmuramoyl-pentapeptide-transferase [Gemmatimonadaceae bacterium]NUP55161.1 phospho-N-acetylmuramoyl-pentapeptide-transferase [Gemmatimonadaceae bacterium]NUP70572.1 phospho-N-acetylmuramoyl-pentapeptide-transferase [Gemmatimonadaceae bacterium]NUR35421.1 phospho-N-acetylmuramoyl-pentapeptide-transferase [Gemmatimonadaceae bacterium]
MLYYLFVPLIPTFHVLNVFTYITFRAAGAVVTAILLSFAIGPAILRRLNAAANYQVVREGTPDTHAVKGKTPTMGGLIFLFSSLVATLLWARIFSHYVMIAILVTAWMGAIGFLDDMLKLRQKRLGLKNEGLVERNKLIGQVAIGLALGTYLWLQPLSPNLPGASITLPFYKYLLVEFTIPLLYVLFVTFILTGVSNAVNLTDGLDGLAGGTSAIAFAVMAIFAYLIGNRVISGYLGIFYLQHAGELTIFCSAMFGALIGFLWFNTFPAQVFMGDTGSLALGGALGAVAIMLKSEFLLIFVGIVFIAETMSVLLQRFVFKYHRRTRGLEYAQQHRVFKRAPLHHHFEVKGWSEQQVVVRFWIIGIIGAFLALSTLKLR